METTGTDRLLVGPTELAKLLSVSDRKLRAMKAAGGLPEPVKLGRSVRWDLAEVRAWVSAGCPKLADWRAMR